MLRSVCCETLPTQPKSRRSSFKERMDRLERILVKERPRINSVFVMGES